MSPGDPAHRGPVRGDKGTDDLPLARRLAIMGGSGLATLGVLAVIGALVFLLAVNGPGPRARFGPSTDVVLNPGSGVADIAGILERQGVIRSSLVFIVASKLGGGRLLAGEYDF
ncbi:MAG: aminodeoxychorismate lyase, partial [Caulobacteraceae bacterium]|nr:aminodeoxychorismate lyase [Caulobacteraceae bacterium]